MSCFRTERAARRSVTAALVALTATLFFTSITANPSAARAAATQAPVTVHFIGAEIDAVARVMAELLQRSIVVDPRVKGTLTLVSDRPQPIAYIYTQFLAGLRGLGYTVVEAGGLLKLVPEADAKLQSSVVSIDRPARTGDQVLTQIYRLQHESAANLIPILRPLISPNNTINANAGNNTLVITDYADNLQRLARIIAAVDLPQLGEVDYVRLRHVVVADVLPMLQRLLEAPAAVTAPGPGGVGGASVQGDARTNSLLVRVSSGQRLMVVRAIIAQLDQPAEMNGASGNIWVVKLKHADATRVATVLRATFGAAGGSPLTGTTTTLASPPSGAPTIGGAGSGPSLSGSAGPSTGGFVQADTATNSLVITAAEPLYRQVRAVIEQLDGRRPQVYIESMIVEVSGDNAADIGFQWQGLIGKSGDAWGLVGGTNYGTTGNILTLSTAESTQQVSVGEGLNLGLLRDFGSAYGLAAVARLLQSQTSVNIVSTPNLITLDNEEAKIVVGSNVPFITGQTAQSSGTGGATTSPFQTIERKDVGITLRIKPQINDGGTVRMSIFQESSSLSDKVAPGTTNAGPSTDKRSIETNVVVDAGQIIVLGGLIEDKYSQRKSKIPVLGDLPFVGALFRSESRTKTRTNLMVFLRPVVMADAASAAALSADRYQDMRGHQNDGAPQPSRLLPIMPMPIPPPLRPQSTGSGEPTEAR